MSEEGKDVQAFRKEFDKFLGKSSKPFGQDLIKAIRKNRGKEYHDLKRGIPLNTLLNHLGLTIRPGEELDLSGLTEEEQEYVRSGKLIRYLTKQLSGNEELKTVGIIFGKILEAAIQHRDTRLFFLVYPTLTMLVKINQLNEELVSTYKKTMQYE